MSAGELAGKKIFLRDNLKAIKRVGYHALPLLVRNIFIREGKINVLADSKIVEQVIALKHHPDVALGQIRTLLALHLMNSFFAKPILAIPCIIEQRQDI